MTNGESVGQLFEPESWLFRRGSIACDACRFEADFFFIEIISICAATRSITAKAKPGAAGDGQSSLYDLEFFDGDFFPVVNRQSRTGRRAVEVSYFASYRTPMAAYAGEYGDSRLGNLKRAPFNTAVTFPDRYSFHLFLLGWGNTIRRRNGTQLGRLLALWLLFQNYGPCSGGYTCLSQVRRRGRGGPLAATFQECIPALEPPRLRLRRSHPA
jgi:hypothetical protein